MGYDIAFGRLKMVGTCPWTWHSRFERAAHEMFQDGEAETGSYRKHDKKKCKGDPETPCGTQRDAIGWTQER